MLLEASPVKIKAFYEGLHIISHATSDVNWCTKQPSWQSTGIAGDFETGGSPVLPGSRQHLSAPSLLPLVDANNSNCVADVALKIWYSTKGHMAYPPHTQPYPSMKEVKCHSCNCWSGTCACGPTYALCMDKSRLSS